LFYASSRALAKFAPEFWCILGVNGAFTAHVLSEMPQPNRQTRDSQKFHGPCLRNDNLLGLSLITQTDKLLLVPSSYLSCGWMCLHSCVTPLISFFSFHMRRKFHKFSESLARKWNTLERNGLTTVATWL